MTGPEHYREAERLLAPGGRRNPWGDVEPVAPSEAAVARAQVHATLALAAATAINPSDYGMGRPEWTEWTAVASVEHARRTARTEVA
jgi:hypothetical protein